MSKSTAEKIYANLTDALMFSYCQFFISGEYKEYFDDDKGRKCEQAVKLLCERWFIYDFSDTESQVKLDKMMNHFDTAVSESALKQEFCDLYIFVKKQNVNDCELYDNVAKAVKTLLKHDFHMSKEEIKALTKN